MKHLIVLLSLFVSQGCGMPNCDLMSGGICIVSNGFDIDSYMILEAIDSVKYQTERVYCEKDCEFNASDLDINANLKNADMVVEFVDYITETRVDIDEDPKRQIGGFYQSSDYIQVVFVQHKEYYSYLTEEELAIHNRSKKFIECASTYYYLGHELMHFVAGELLDKEKSSGNHTTPRFWIQNKKEVEEDTIEYNVFQDVIGACEYYYYEQETINEGDD